MDFRVLEARQFVSSYYKATRRVVKDYEIDVERTPNRIYTYCDIYEKRLSRGDVLVRVPHGCVSSVGAQKSYILTLDFSCRDLPNGYSRNVPGEFQRTSDLDVLKGLAPVIHPRDVHSVMQIYRNLILAHDKNSPFAKELVKELIYTLNAEVAHSNYELLKPGTSFADTITLYLSKNLERRITLSELSELVHLEKSYLVRRFRALTGKTPIEMLVDMRLERAADLVTFSEMKICEIASACGYPTVSFFISEYKKRYGVTPELQRRTIVKS